MGMKKSIQGIYMTCALLMISFASNGRSETQSRNFEAGIEFDYQESVGNRFQISYRWNEGRPGSMMPGFNIGYRLFNGNSDEQKIIQAQEYGFSLATVIIAQPDYHFYTKASIQNLILPRDFSSKSSTSSLNIEFGKHQRFQSYFWEFGVGLRYRDQDREKIFIGKDTIEKTFLVYPRLSFGMVF